MSDLEMRFMYDADFHAFVETFRQLTDVDIETALDLVGEAFEIAEYRRPTYGCWRTDLPPLKLSDVDRAIKETYAPALTAALNAPSIFGQLYALTEAKRTRRQKVRRWITRHTPHVHVTWGY